MDLTAPLHSAATFGGALAYGALSSVVPAFSAELYIVGAAALVPRAMQPLLLLCFTIGTMAGKTFLYLAAERVVQRSPPRAKVKVESWVGQLQRHRRWAWLLVLVSAFVGLPPFYFVSLAAGILRLGLAGFWVFGSVGRACRFAAIAWAVEGLSWIWR